MNKLIAKLKALWAKLIAAFRKPEQAVSPTPAVPPQQPSAEAAIPLPTSAPVKPVEPTISAPAVPTVGTNVPKPTWFDITGTPTLDEFGLWRPYWLAEAVAEVEARAPYGVGVKPLPLALHVIEAQPFAPSQAASDLIRLNCSQLSTAYSTDHGHFRGPCSEYAPVPVNAEYPHLGTQLIPSRELPRTAAVLIDTTRYVSRYVSESQLRAGFRKYHNLPV